MTEMYSQDELARAWGEVDSILGEDYRNERLGKICLQARKNRLWEAHGNEAVITETHGTLPSWGNPETSEPIVFTADGPIPFSQVPEKLKKVVITKDLDEPTAAG